MSMIVRSTTTPPLLPSLKPKPENVGKRRSKTTPLGKILEIKPIDQVGCGRCTTYSAETHVQKQQQGAPIDPAHHAVILEIAKQRERALVPSAEPAGDVSMTLLVTGRTIGKDRRHQTWMSGIEAQKSLDHQSEWISRLGQRRFLEAVHVVVHRAFPELVLCWIVPLDGC